ncbi:MAG: DUF4058 family protein [Alkalinema sp. RU_4_3]|nr:DUF4058 family protein [Alkalinema sp. RU_4_3]
MPSPFPGMDPYLEQPIFWSEFHNRLIVAIADAIVPDLLPRYYVGVETRTYRDSEDGELLIGIPDAVILSAKTPLPSLPAKDSSAIATRPKPQEVILPLSTQRKERYLEVREAGTDAVIAVIEVLSPKHKRKGDGRTAYEAKRQKILDSASHLVEIDLLRADLPMAMQGAAGSDYRIIVSRSEQRPKAQLYGFTLQEAIPSFPLPLKSASEQVIVDLQEIVQGVYDRGGYAIRIDYNSKPTV